MGFEDALSYLEELGVDAMKSMGPSMERIEALCEALAHPERTIPAVHVTGTNGKTSTARIAASVLTETDLRVGTYTSPHLQSVRERITLNGVPISKDDFGEVFDHLKPYIDLIDQQMDARLTYFEILTAMYFLWAAENVDVSVVEVGLGGRWDATNLLSSTVGVITNVGLDHTALLGEDATTIAKEKAGIVKPEMILVTGARVPNVLEVIENEVVERDARLLRIDRDFVIAANRLAVGGRLLDIETTAGIQEELFLPLHGAHQGLNAACALQAVISFLPEGSLDRAVIDAGFARTIVPGRMETIVGEEDSIVLDVAHNPEGMSALVGALVEAFGSTSVVFVLGVLADKDYRGMLLELARLDCRLVVTQAKTVRSVPPDELKRTAEELGLEATVIDDVGDAIKKARSLVVDGDLLCVTGSHYVVGEARTHLLGPTG